MQTALDMLLNDAVHTIRADAHTQHVISHLEGAGVVDSQLACLAAILLYDSPLPKLDFLVCAATHKATAATEHASALTAVICITVQRCSCMYTVVVQSGLFDSSSLPLMYTSKSTCSRLLGQVGDINRQQPCSCSSASGGQMQVADKYKKW